MRGLSAWLNATIIATYAENAHAIGGGTSGIAEHTNMIGANIARVCGEQNIATIRTTNALLVGTAGTKTDGRDRPFLRARAAILVISMVAIIIGVDPREPESATSTCLKSACAIDENRSQAVISAR